VPEPAVALLAALMLRGPQTPGELRIATERLHRFADLGGVEAALRELAGRAAADGGPLVVQLPRQPGAREQRWAHLLSGPVDIAASTQAAVVPKSSVPDATGAEIATLRAEIARVAAETAELRAIVERLARDRDSPA
jgi:uncharacterized protein YceH (UPF0502 family)